MLAQNNTIEEEQFFSEPQRPQQEQFKQEPMPTQRKQKLPEKIDLRLAASKLMFVWKKNANNSLIAIIAFVFLLVASPFNWLAHAIAAVFFACYFGWEFRKAKQNEQQLFYKYQIFNPPSKLENFFQNMQQNYANNFYQNQKPRKHEKNFFEDY